MVGSKLAQERTTPAGGREVQERSPEITNEDHGRPEIGTRPPRRRPWHLVLGAGGAALLAALLATLGAPPGPPEIVRLTPGEELVIDLAPGNSRRVRLSLPDDRRPYVLEAEQQGIDVALELAEDHAPRAQEGSDEPAAAADRPFDRSGTERLWIEPGTTAHDIRIVAREPGAPPGRCRVSLRQLPPREEPTARAEWLESEAAVAYHRRDPESLAVALDRFREAASLWQRADTRRRQAEALYAVTVLHRLVDEIPQALETGRETVRLWQEEEKPQPAEHTLDERRWEAATWNEIGLSSWLSGDPRSARWSFERARALQVASRDAYGEAVSLANLCLMDLDAGELRAGLACYEQMLGRLAAVRAPALEATAHSNVGRVHDLLGQPQDALDHYQRALDLVRSAEDREGEARVLNNLGVLHRRLGEISAALARYSEALQVFRTLGDRRWQARVLNNLGLLYGYAGDLAKARLSLEEALPLRRAVEDRRGEATTLTNLGLVTAREGTGPAGAERALALYRQSLALRRSSGDRQGEAVTLRQMGRLAVERGQPGAALEPLRSAVQAFRDLGDPTGEALTLADLARALSALGRPAVATGRLERALALARDTGHRPVEMVVLTGLARASRQRGRVSEARRWAVEGVELVERLRGQIDSTDLEVAFRDARHDLYQLEIELLMDEHRRDPVAGWDRRAFVAVEQARARTLLDLLGPLNGAGEPDTGLVPAVPTKLAARHQRLLRRLRVAAERSATAGEDSNLDRSLEEVLRALDLTEAEIRSVNPRYADLATPRPIDPAEATRLLGEGTLLLSYQLGRERSFLWLVGRDRFESFELPGSERIEGLARKLHRSLSRFDPAARPTQQRLAAELAGIVLGPVADILARPRAGPGVPHRLVVVTDGALGYVPFEVLPAPTEVAAPGALPLLIDRFEVAYLPSVSTLASLRRMLRSRVPAPDPLAVLADPVFSADDPRVAGPASATRPDVGGEETTPRRSGFPRLRSSGQEARMIASLAPPGATLLALGLDADREAVLHLERFRVIHFATHGVLDTERPAASGLALSLVDERRAPDAGGFLSLRDLYGLHLGADLVVLSGCRTAAGKTMRGEGLIGLARGFMYAGSPRVVASLWQVDDRATARLMASFYRGLWQRHQAPAAGLARAKRDLRADPRFQDPWYWAAFVLQGEWM